MFGIQTSELLVIAFVAVLVFGPEKVPELFHRFGRLVGRFQRSADEMWTTLQTEVNQARRPLEGIADDVKEALADPDAPSAADDEDDPPASEGEDTPPAGDEEDGPETDGGE